LHAAVTRTRGSQEELKRSGSRRTMRDSTSTMSDAPQLEHGWPSGPRRWRSCGVMGRCSPSVRRRATTTCTPAASGYSPRASRPGLDEALCHGDRYSLPAQTKSSRTPRRQGADATSKDRQRRTLRALLTVGVTSAMRPWNIRSTSGTVVLTRSQRSHAAGPRRAKSSHPAPLVPRRSAEVPADHRGPWLTSPAFHRHQWGADSWLMC
jgi:hypothetical protein